MATRRPLKLSEPGNKAVANYRIGIVVAQWHSDITGKLLKGVMETMKKHGITPVLPITHVPGSFELPLGAQWLMESKKVDAVLCLGCVIQGETPHFDFISDAVANGIMKLNLKYNKPFIFGVLTTNTLKQAQERSGGRHGNKGSEAALTAIEMLGIKNKR